MAEVKEQHAQKRRASQPEPAAAAAAEEDVGMSLAELKNLNINASLSADPEEDPLPPALFHRENTTTLCVFRFA